MKTFRVIREFSHVYEVQADSAIEAENAIIHQNIQPVEMVWTDYVYTEEIL